MASSTATTPVRGPRAEAAEEPPTCPVCISPYNRTPRGKPVHCAYCPATACVTCTQTYLTTTTEDPHCMGCRTRWNREFVDLHLTSAFRNGPYKRHRERVLLERERAMMPLRQPRAAAARSVRALEQRIPALQAQAQEATRRVHRAEMHVAYTRAFATGHRDRDPGPFQEDEVVAAAARGGEASEEVVRRFVRACPAADCRGFLSSAWKCGVCEVWACPDCHELKGAERDAPHTCDPSTLASARLIARDSRPCPHCAALIHRIEGCSAMFCTQCHTSFDWNTGKVANGPLHNPHYFEWLASRRGAAAEGAAEEATRDGACAGQGLPTAVELNQVLSTRAAPRVQLFNEVMRFVADLQEVRLPQYDTADPLLANVDLGVAFLNHQMDEAGLQVALQQREKAREKKRDFREVLQMVAAVLTDILRTLYEAVRAQSRLPPAASPEALRAMATALHQAGHAVPPLPASTTAPPTPEVLRAVATASRDLAALFDMANANLRRIGVRYACVSPGLGVHLAPPTAQQRRAWAAQHPIPPSLPPPTRFGAAAAGLIRAPQLSQPPPQPERVGTVQTIGPEGVPTTTSLFSATSFPQVRMLLCTTRPEAALCVAEGLVHLRTAEEVAADEMA